MKKAIFLVFIFLFYINVSYAVNILNSPNLVSRWRMDDVNQTGEGAMVYDYIEKNNGIAKRTAIQTDAGYFGKGFAFTGFWVSNSDTDAINMGNNLNFNYLSNFSFSLWAIKTGTIYVGGGVMSMMGKGIFTTSSYGICFIDSVNQINFGVRKGSSFSRSVSSNTTLLNWTHIVGTYEANSATGIKLYVNGTLVGNASTTGLSSFANTYNFCLGGCTTGIGGNIYPFNGTIDEAIVFNKTLTSEEVLELWNWNTPTCDKPIISGTHNIDCSEHCVIDSYDVDRYNYSFYNTGEVWFDSFNSLSKAGSNYPIIERGCIINLKK